MSIVNELAKERTRGAAERTLIAWTLNCLALMLFGLALDPILLAIAPRMAQRLAPLVESAIALVFVVTGLLLLAIALVQHQLAIAAIEQAMPPIATIQRLNRWVTGAVLTLGILALGAIMLLTA
ncbi:MAG: DUF202 domain-containing protein [Leptolyngbya sp.]|nr:DUF202 domain-containing protein [Leptolyngbya sp.]